ncbi:type VI secretion system-associated FHA domain protein TagH [Thalassomonas viridans]|uniref:Type VI secretion system-associated FHA domain protein TagH n=1 Tax=Thalassomonas viridans TaxID=137584 RepID=A0AAF0C720_9GAMM|nr:type VI secretion system-associated FHA domain protein TagH [Thalassomonas viridans]WDE02881.1 type VI secretion system-associated FHA domain protein TagH [Thalassomonas viridans]
MAATLELSVVNTQQPQTPAQVISIDEAGATIGRGADNSCVLEDAKRFISAKHAQVDYFQDSFFLTDTSTNGCWLQGAGEAIGKGNRVKLDSNSVIIVGPYELHFHLLQGADSDLAVSPDKPVFTDNSRDPIQQILTDIEPGHTPSEPALSQDLPTSPAPLDSDNHQHSDIPLSDGADNALDGYFKPEHAAVEKIPTDWDFNEPACSPEQQALEPVGGSNKQGEHSDGNIQQIPTASAVELPVQASDESEGKKAEDSRDAIVSLSRQLGLELPPELLQNPEPFIGDITDVVNEAVAGIIRLINGRAVFKQSSRLSMTTIQPRSNNPLKFSADKHEALEHLFTRSKPAYLGAKAAVRQAITDVQIHEMAYLAGLQAALLQVLEALSPGKIEETTAAPANKLRGLLSAPKHWQQYKAVHQQLKARINENLNEFLGQDFARAYEQQVLKLNQEHQESSK